MSFQKAIVPAVLFVALCGCERNDPANVHPFRQNDSAFVLLIAIDPQLISRNSNVYEFTSHSIERYFEDRIGFDDDQLIIASLTGDRQSILWQGTPLSLREEFPTPEAFYAMIRGKTAGGQPLVHDNLVRALKYVQMNRSVADGKAQSATLFLCDLSDKSSQADEQALLKAIVSYIENGGLIGFYYLSQDSYFHWDQLFKDAGYPWVDIECDVHGRPTLPDFEDIRRPFK